MLWILILFFIVVSFGVQGIYAQEEGAQIIQIATQHAQQFLIDSNSTCKIRDCSIFSWCETDFYTSKTIDAKGTTPYAHTARIDIEGDSCPPFIQVSLKPDLELSHVYPIDEKWRKTTLSAYIEIDEITVEESSLEENNPPIVEILSPKEGDSFEKIVPIQWTSSDPEGEKLSHTVQLRLGEERTWLTLEKNYLGNSLDHKIPSPYAIKDGQIRILVSDGKNESQDISGTFSANLKTGTDLTELDVRWDPFDKRWQAYVVETDGILFLALLFFGGAIAIAIVFGFAIYFGTTYLMKRKLKQSKLEKKYKFAALGIAALVVIFSLFLWVFRG